MGKNVKGDTKQTDNNMSGGYGLTPVEKLANFNKEQNPLKKIFLSPTASDILNPIYRDNNSIFSLYWMKKYPYEFAFILGIIIYFIIVIVVYTKNPYNIITDNNAGLTIFVSILGIFLILMTILFYMREKQETENVETASILSKLGKFFTLFGSITAFVLIVIVIVKVFSYFSDASVLILLIINIFIVLGLLAVAVKYFGMSGSEPKEQKASIMGLLWKALMYAPCLLLDLIDYLKQQYQITTKPIIIILMAEIVLIGLYFLYPVIMKYILTHNADQLIKESKKLNQENRLGTFRELNYVDDQFQYHYAVSGWIYIDSFPPETNSKYDEYTSLLNIGNKPNILFNVLKNTLRITMETEGKTEEIIYETTDFKMQRWNNIIVNYDGATLDIFINNNLVSSTPGIIPYNADTVMSSGTTNGIYGGVCNVNYYKDSISRSQINWAYNSVKNVSPPVI
jgi:hypothetical protein|tara:strand:- start:114 stop:1475 length:1362 start_codon:yes stop_codon:yes gene_type:complete